MQNSNGISRLALGAATAFVFDGAGRMLRANDPDAAPAPLLCLSGCAQGNRFWLRHDVSARTADAIAALISEEPPLAARDSVPLDAAKYHELLAPQFPLARSEIALDYILPNGLELAHGPRIVRSGTEEGDVLARDLARHGVPAGLREMGFKDVGEFWPPWCVALVNGETASIAFAARLGPQGAALGVATARVYRGRGLAAAVTASWTAHPELAERTLFYSHAVENDSSRRVTERLGLRFSGAQFAVW